MNFLAEYRMSTRMLDSTQPDWQLESRWQQTYFLQFA